MLKFIFTLASGNKKTGPIPVSTTIDTTCPSACPLKSGGCYAKHGPLAIVWRRVRKVGIGLADFCIRIRQLPPDTLWRHNQAGDLPGEGDKIDTAALAEIVSANRGRRGFTYTHKPSSVENVNAIRDANKKGFTINWSADSLEDADRKAELMAGPVVTILPSHLNGKHRLLTPKGKPVVVCPASYNPAVTCYTCRLCQWAEREVIIGFPAHGTLRKKVDNLLMDTPLLALMEGKSD